MGLLDLIRGTQISGDEACASAIHATDGKESEDSVAKIAVAPSTKDKYPQAPEDELSDSDRYCWPHSPAMNSVEIRRMVSRMELFCAKGLAEDCAEALAERLVLRDRELDDRRVCYECSHLKGMVRVRCDNWKAAGNLSDSAFLAEDFCTLLRRCAGFEC